MHVVEHMCILFAQFRFGSEITRESIAKELDGTEETVWRQRMSMRAP